MKSLIGTILIALTFVFSISAQDTREKVAPAAAKVDASVLHVEVENGKTLDLTVKDLAKFTRREIKAKGHDGKESAYSGYNLSEILLTAGAKIGKDELRGKELGSYLSVEAADGYKATFAIAEIAPEFTDKIVLLADTRDGKPLSATEATWQLIVPDDKKHGRWVRQVIKLSIKSATSAATSNNLIDKLSDEDLIQAIVFRKVLESWNSNAAQSVKTYCLSVDNGKDPSEHFLKAFSDDKFSIIKASDCYLEGDGKILSRELLSKENAQTQNVLFSVSTPNWESKDTVKVSVGNQSGNLGGNGCDYILRKENNVWKIISTKNCYVS